MKILIALFLFSVPLHATVIDQAGWGCPDGTCIWVIGRDFGDLPAIKLTSKSGKVWTLPHRSLNYSQTASQQSISFSLETATQIQEFDHMGLSVQVLNNQTLKYSKSVFVSRSGLPRFNEILPANLVAFESGGTNYAIFDNSQATIVDPYKEIKMVVTHYHEYRDQINNVLRQMYLNGQRKLSLVIWYHVGDLADCRYLIIASIINGDFCSQHKQNVVDILAYASELGYNEVFLRFANYGNVNPGEWTELNEPIVQEVESAIFNIRDYIEYSFYGSSLKRTYDVCLECGGHTHGVSAAFALRLYKSYVQRYGVSDTIGVSFAYYPGRIRHFLQMVDQEGLPRPRELAVDIYKTEDGDFFRLKQELIGLGESNTPIVLLETWYNNGATSSAVRSARENFKLQIRTMLQWQIQPGNPLFSPAEPTGFDAYIEPLQKPTVVSSSVYNSSTSFFLALRLSPQSLFVKAEFFTDDGRDEYIGESFDLRTLKGPYYVNTLLYRVLVPPHIYSNNPSRRFKVRLLTDKGAVTDLWSVSY